MEAVDAIDFITSGVLFCAINLEHVSKDCLGTKVTTITTSETDRLTALECEVQQLKATNEPEAINASKFVPKNSASLINNDVTCASQEPIIMTSPKQVSKRQLRIQKKQHSVGNDSFQLVQ